ncbi:MAG: AAA family ATPase, partial [Erysipelotrichaceae bacterium]|nr:AAA family ATPase [Erysipelotrichaceae bacterium]
MAQSILDSNARYHIRLITGNNDNIFVCEDLVMRNLDEYIHYHLKKKGFEKIIFFDGAGNLGEYYLDEHSAQLVRGKAVKKKKRRRVSLLGDDEEELESQENEHTSVDRIKFPQITSCEFLPTYKTQISDPNHKTAIVFSNIVSFIHTPADAFQSYFDFIQYGFDENNENLTLFIAKEQAIESIEQLKNPTNDYFFNLIKSNLVHEVGSPDNHEIKLFLRRLKMIGLNHKYITFDEKDLDIISEIIRMSMLDRISRNNVEEINRRYAGSEERTPHVALSYMSMGEIYAEFKTFLDNSQNTVNNIDDKTVRQIFHYNDALEENPYDVLMHTRGWEPVAKVIKEEMKNFHNESKKEHYSIEEAKNRLENNSNSDGKQYRCPNYILIGNPGVGKTSVAKLIGRIFKENGILKNGNVITVNSSALIGEYVGQTPSKTNRLIDSAKGGVLIIDEAYSLYANPHVRNDTNAGEFRQEAVDTLVSRALDNDICIILAGYSSVRKLYEMNEGFSSRFQEIVIPSYEPDLLEHIFRNLCLKDCITIHDSIDLTRFVTNLKAFSPKRSFANAREIENIYHSVKQNMRERDNTSNEMTRDDFKAYDRYFMDVGTQQIVDKIKTKIDQEYVGLENVKEFIQNLRYKILREKRAEQKGAKISSTKRNILLMGNPGAGKTTVASLLSEFFYEMGVLASPDMIVVKANSTSSTQLGIYIEEANDKGKLLFIDEANYYCNVGNAGKEMISPILNPSEDFKNYPDLRIVMAIYPKNKDKFYQLDDGMERRFQEFTLNDYTSDELYQIFEIKRKEAKLDISDEKNEFGYTLNDYIRGY